MLYLNFLSLKIRGERGPISISGFPKTDKSRLEAFKKLHNYVKASQNKKYLYLYDL